MVAGEASAIATNEVKNNGFVQEEVKKPNVRKVEDVLDDGKSEASYFSKKTNKTIGGKAFDKHCPLCEFKLIRGDYWSRHRKMVQKDVEVAGMKCSVGCLQYKSKYLILFKNSHLVPKAHQLP